ncbi:MAG TPA: polysaccharide biosynthesis protein [Tissierellia bacterium]|nr:polysaccharide biosynthesis protein [Tissierellia bacterium]
MKRKTAILLLIFDVICINLAYFLPLYSRFGGNVLMIFANSFIRHIPIILFIKIFVFYGFKLYKSLWEFASIDELVEVVEATVISNIISVFYLLVVNAGLPVNIYLMVLILDMAFIGGSRFCIRILRRFKIQLRVTDKNFKKVLIVGAGAAGSMVIRELRNHNGLNSKPVAIIDDDPAKKNLNINGIPVVGNRNDIVHICKKYNIDEIIIAIPSASRKDIKEIVNECKKTRCKTKILPGVYEIIDGKVNVSTIREVDISDLLGREEVKLDMEGINQYINGKRILVTGGGGSIGSELCRQIANFSPKELIVFDIYENNAYDIQNELLRKHKDLPLTVVIGSVRDRKCLEELFREKKIDIVFHAAAHKHVPLMEHSPKEAIKNNVFGTLNVVELADKYNVSKFVLISTDKAVNPTNVMGATKRITEMIIQTKNMTSNTDFVAVRFGNVLGSNGSVIPLFKKQIEEGGPVTVTHPEVVRYFMTIPEACQLVLQSGAMAKGGEIFVLDMGEPVKILDLARDLIKLSGFEPDVDIKIEITGLRPGEKLYEEPLLNDSTVTKTAHNKIYVEKPMVHDYSKLEQGLNRLKNALEYGSNDLIRSILSDIVPTYKYKREEEKRASDIGLTRDSYGEVAVAHDN